MLFPFYKILTYHYRDCAIELNNSNSGCFCITHNGDCYNFSTNSDVSRDNIISAIKQAQKGKNRRTRSISSPASSNPNIVDANPTESKTSVGTSEQQKHFLKQKKTKKKSKKIDKAFIFMPSGKNLLNRSAQS